jgi:mannose-6-phosphate isomerase-like protein (cupin superfamily)
MKISLRDALQQLEKVDDEFVELFAKRDINIEFYKPDKVDKQTPHTRDEIYIVISGSGMFINGEKKVSFSAGDFLFVKAGLEHKFIEFSDDFSTWVVFFGPEIV